MKKIQFAAGLMGLAMLGACSSDAPEMTTPDNGEDGNMYLAITLKGTDTRADGDVEGYRTGTDAENKINKVQLFIIDENENLYFQATADGTNGTSVDGNVAKFKVSSVVYNDMLAKQARGAEMQFIVYANGTTLTSSDAILHGQTSDPTWGVQFGDNSAGYNRGGFIMSNAEAANGTFNEVKTTTDAPADGSSANPWLIKSDVKLARLATRFDYVPKTADDGKYVPAANKNMEFYVVGMDVETYASDTYRTAMFSANGQLPTGALTSTNHKHYKPEGTLKYRVTDVVEAGKGNLEFGTYAGVNDFNYDNLTATNKTIYRRPNTVSTAWNWYPEGENFYLNYTVAPFAVIKVEFKNISFAGLEWGSVSMAAGEDVYAVNGVFLGGFSDFMKMREEKKEFKIEYSDEDAFSPAEKTRIASLVSAYNNLLNVQTLPSQYASNADKTDAEKLQLDKDYFVSQLGEAEEYHAVKDADGNNHYYTYFAHLILHDATSSDLCWKYGVSRNTCYELKVNSFKGMGNNGTGHPGQGPSVTDFSDMYINLTVEVLKWNLNIANEWDL
ncbi:MAG: fimbria major subunit [Bacteroides sp.]|nr:fimbria major subunit [Bacteroidales bacterium]MBD5302110.1 fimbria major subunit [Bacteroides sp.]MBD5305739.1 fimbria major subunit [Bacteroides sp.]